MALRVAKRPPNAGAYRRLPAGEGHVARDPGNTPSGARSRIERRIMASMRANRMSPTAFTIEFESDDELRSEHESNLRFGGLRLLVADPPALHSVIDVTLLGPGSSAEQLRATVVAPIPGGVALAFDGDPDALLERLLPPPSAEPLSAGDADEAPQESEESQSVVDRLRDMQRVQKIIHAKKADRSERAYLVQDRDPQVLTSLLRNPRITIDEVVRVAKSSFLNYQVAELIVTTGQFMAAVEVRIALIHNPKTPPTFAMRILPTLPESEVRNIAKGAATSMQLKQAALKRLQGGK